MSYSDTVGGVRKGNSKPGISFYLCFFFLNVIGIREVASSDTKFVFLLRQCQSYLHTIAKIWEEGRDIDILERVQRERERY